MWQQSSVTLSSNFQSADGAHSKAGLDGLVCTETIATELQNQI